MVFSVHGSSLSVSYSPSLSGLRSTASAMCTSAMRGSVMHSTHGTAEGPCGALTGTFTCENDEYVKGSRVGRGLGYTG